MLDIRKNGSTYLSRLPFLGNRKDKSRIGHKSDDDDDEHGKPAQQKQHSRQGTRIVEVARIPANTRTQKTEMEIT